MSVPLDRLRRPYSRHLSPHETRPVEELAASLEDVVLRWSSFLDGCFGKEPGTRCMNVVSTSPQQAREGWMLAERLSHQVKGVKQELLVHLHRYVGGSSSHTCTNTDLGPQRLCGTRHRTVCGWEESLPPSQGVLSSVYHKVLLLARRAWVWSILLAVTLADMELLTGSIAFGAGLFFSFPKAGCSSQGADTRCEDGEHLLVSNEYNGRTALSERVLCASALASGDLPVASALEMFCGCAERSPLSFVMDGAFTHACVLMYHIIVGDEVGAIQQYTAISRFLEDASHDNADDTVDSARSSPLSRALDGVIDVAEFLAAKDYPVAHKVLEVYSRNPTGKILFHSLQLLLRVMYEHVVRRQLIHINMGNSFRPVPPNDVASSSAESCENALYSAIRHARYSVEGRPEVATALDIIEAVQEESFRLRGGPWPLPAALLQTTFSLVS